MKYRAYADAFWELLFPEPHQCILCRQPLAGRAVLGLCVDCHRSVRVREKGRWIQSSPLEAGRSMPMFSVLHYGGEVAKLIYRFKYHQETYLARNFGALMAAFAIREALCFDVIYPVPLHRRRKGERGFNQAGLLAKYMARYQGWRVDGRNLVRVRETVAMFRLNKVERMKNVRDAFYVKDKGKVQGQNILLVDDILTTGATLEACGALLLQAGARSVTALTLAYRPKFD